jgi:hypothetical protein
MSQRCQWYCCACRSASIDTTVHVTVVSITDTAVSSADESEVCIKKQCFGSFAKILDKIVAEQCQFLWDSHKKAFRLTIGCSFEIWEKRAYIIRLVPYSPISATHCWEKILYNVNVKLPKHENFNKFWDCFLCTLRFHEYYCPYRFSGHILEVPFCKHSKFKMTYPKTGNEIYFLCNFGNKDLYSQRDFNNSE